MKILGIETSCDETASAIVENGVKVLSSAVASSEDIHKKYGGIIPEKAAREQIKCIIPIIQESEKKSCYKIKNLDAIAVTLGPGLIGSLIVGLETAKTLSLVFKKPIIPVNHLVAHIYANFLNKKRLDFSSIFPALCLIVSGGHTELVFMKNHGQFRWLGGTRDDAAGECLDKSARLLGFGYPGGPEIETAALKFKQQKNLIKKAVKLKFPRPMISDNNFDFSFSGLKTAVLYQLKNQFKNKLSLPLKQQIAFELQEAVCDVLVKKTLKAAIHVQAKSILIGGGVAANQRLRQKLRQKAKSLKKSRFKLFLPEKKWATDNAASIAGTAFFNPKKISWTKLKPQPSLHFKK
jgi:N6-L-threonylcarbamoyladenine synthase